VFEYAIGEEQRGEICFLSNFQCCDGMKVGGLILPFVGSTSDMKGVFHKIDGVEFNQTDSSLNSSDFYNYCSDKRNLFS
jgi:hypothetical protein